MIKYISNITDKGNSSFSYSSPDATNNKAKLLDDNNCTNCVNCADCTDCMYSADCADCVDCIDCVDYIGLRGVRELF